MKLLALWLRIIIGKERNEPFIHSIMGIKLLIRWILELGANQTDHGDHDKQAQKN